MKKLRVEIALATPIVLPAMPIHLDALLAFAVTENALQALSDEENTEGFVRDLAEQGLESVLDRHHQDGNWVWKASALLPVGVGDSYLRMWTRKTDPYDYAERIRSGQIASRAKFPLKPFAMQIDTVRGLLKNHFNFYPVREVSELHGYCIGVQAEIQDLLETHISHVGSRRRSGHGKVSAIRVIEDPQADELWKARMLPWEQDGYVPMQAAFRPPYWAIEQRAQAYCPPAIIW